MTRKIYELTQSDLDTNKDIAGLHNPSKVVLYSEERSPSIVEPTSFSVTDPKHTGTWTRVDSEQYGVTTITFDDPLPIYSEFMFENIGEGTVSFVSGTIPIDPPPDTGYTPPVGNTDANSGGPPSIENGGDSTPPDLTEDKWNFVMSSLSSTTVTGSHRVVLAKVMSADTILLTGALDDL